MLFTSYEFIAFLLILFLVYYLIPKRFQWMLLLAANYIFYFFSGPKFLIYILTTTVSAYIAGNRIHSLHEEQAAYLAENKGACPGKTGRSIRLPLSQGSGSGFYTVCC